MSQKNKETGISVGFFFSFFAWVYIYKQEVVVIEIPEWKLKAKLAGNTLYLKKIRRNFLPVLRQK